MNEQEQLIWMAAFFDGEGHIGLHLEQPANGRQRRLRFKVQVSNTDRRALVVYRSRFGATRRDFYTYYPELPNRRPVSRWEQHGEKAYRFLKAIRPYLVIKGEQADLAIKFWELPWRNRPPGKPRPAAQIDVDLQFVREMRALKRA